MAVFAIGDIHGCLYALKEVVNTAEIQRGDTIVLLGDVVSKGPDSRGVVDWILDNSGNFNLVVLRGNHEDMLLQLLNGGDGGAGWMRKGGSAVLESYGTSFKVGWEKSIPESHWQFFRSTLRYWTFENFIFVHAGVEPGIPLEEQDDFTLYWKKFRKPVEYAQGLKVIFGHTALKDGRILDFGHSICLDTYAYGGQWLSCLNIHTREYWQASEKRKSRFGKL